MDQGRQRRDQVDAAVVPDVRRQCGATSASCARLQSRQFPTHAGDAGADQGLVADEPEGQADQDRREGREPRPLRRLPDGRGRHPTANVRGYLAIDRRTTAAATTSASVRRSMVMHSAATDRRSASKCQGKWPDQALNASWTAWSIGSWQDLQFCACPQSRKSLTFTSVRDSTGESRLNAIPPGLLERLFAARIGSKAMLYIGRFGCDPDKIPRPTLLSIGAARRTNLPIPR